MTQDGLPSELRRLCQDGAADYDLAMAEGKRLDLSDCLYGGPDRGQAREPYGYYYVLAGLVRSRGYRRVVEIGTHYGGSTLALSHGIAESATDDACVVTIDITR